MSAPRRSRSRRSPFSVVLGVFGELLITVGMFFGLFVVWQLYWTDFEVHREQVALRAEFEADAPPTVDEPAGALVKRFDNAPPLPEVGPGEIQAVLRIPALNEYAPGGDYWYQIASNADPMKPVLDAGHIVRYPGADPGQLGNFALAGHRQTHGGPFYHADKLEAGDAVIVESEDAWYVFRVSDRRIVAPTETGVIAANPFDPGAAPTASVLTITTCHPIFSTRERMIVHADFEYWVPRAEGTPAELLED